MYVYCKLLQICEHFQIPEEKEVFTITIFNPTGDAKMGNITTATLEINKNDDAIFFAGNILSWKVVL